jgi:hypothetical protein
MNDRSDPGGGCRLGSAGGAIAASVVVAPRAGSLTNGVGLVPPPLHDASAAASNARPTSERSQS